MWVKQCGSQSSPMIHLEHQYGMRGMSLQYVAVECPVMIPNRLLAALPLPTDIILLCMCPLAVAVASARAHSSSARQLPILEDEDEEGWRGRKRPPSRSRGICPAMSRNRHT